MSRSYDWDEVKAEANVRQHAVSFGEAETVVDDMLSLWVADVAHSDVEARLRIVGWSAKGRLLVVIVSASGSRPRIISARRATKRERHVFETRP
jgi:uncharacterized protein